MRFSLHAIVLLAVSLVPVQAASIYTSYSSWSAAVTGQNQMIFPGPVNVPDTGVLSYSFGVGTLYFDAYSHGWFTTTSVYSDLYPLPYSPTQPNYFQIGFNDPTTAVGFDFDGEMGPVSVELNLGAGGPFPLPDKGGFFGITSTTPFTKLKFAASPSKTYVELNWAKYGVKADDVVIPEPATFILLGAALIAIQLRRKRVKT